MDKSETWYELAREILKSAKDRISVRDFEIQSKDNEKSNLKIRCNHKDLLCLHFKN